MCADMEPIKKMKQLSIFNPETVAIAAALKRQKMIASHYAEIAMNRDRLETEALNKLQSKDQFTDDYLEG